MSIEEGTTNDLTPGVVKLERVWVTCPGCGQQVEAVASDGRVRGWCSISRQRVNFLIERGKNPKVETKAKISASVQDPEVKDGVVRDYLRGAKTIVTQLEYKISPGTLYRILHASHVKLRTDTGSERSPAGILQLKQASNIFFGLTQPPKVYRLTHIPGMSS